MNDEAAKFEIAAAAAIDELISATRMSTMTLRDHFAAAALQGIIAHGADAPLKDMADRTRGGAHEAAAAYAWADAMLAERAK
jgi:hypothetical protein